MHGAMLTVTGEHGAMVHHAVLAGVRVRSNLPLTRMPAAGRSDQALDVVFERRLRGAAPGGAWALDAAGCRGWLAADGRAAAIELDVDASAVAAALVRRVLPFASTLQGGTVLHGAALLLPDGVHVFVGESGAGKSTLAAALAALRIPLVADDLTPCRADGDDVEVALPASAPAGAARAPLAGVHFLARSRACARASFSALSRAQCVAQLLRNGFSELAAPAIWARQFAAYTRIAQRVPAFALTVPDDRTRLAAIAADVQAGARALAAARA